MTHALPLGCFVPFSFSEALVGWGAPSLRPKSDARNRVFNTMNKINNLTLGYA